MKKQQSALTVVRMAQSHAQSELAEQGRIRPGIFMLVLRNPQTDGRLSQPTAIGSIVEEGFADPEDQEQFLQGVREEAQRLEAVAVALCLQAEAELEGESKTLPVAVVHIEDESGLTLLHAPIEPGDKGPQLGAFVALEGREAIEASGIHPPLLQSSPAVDADSPTV